MNIIEIAQLAGVSRSTVSRVINNSDRASIKTKKKVLEVIKNTGYIPNNIARSLKIKKTMTIGVLFPDIGNPFYFEVLRGVEKKLYEKDFNIMLCNSDYDDSKELRYISLLASKKVDGIIAAPCSENSKGIALLQKWDMPFVLIDIPQNNIKTNGIFVDHSYCSYIATNYLIENGHKRIAIIDAKRNTKNKSKFVKGYAKSLSEHGIPIDKEIILERYPDINNGYIVIKKLIKNKIDFSAVITINDLLAVGVYKAASQVGLNIPGDLSVIGNDNIPLSKFLHPPLTTIHQPKLSLGYKSAELLLEYVKGPNNPYQRLRTLTLDVKLIKRGSVRRKDDKS
jgi:LacI family transcriptional regulator